MNRLIVALAAVIAIGGPLAAASEANAQQRGGADRRDDRGRDNRGGRDWNDRGRGNQGWDNRRNNGYYYNNRWSYGPPPAAYYGRPAYRPGYQQWSRGQYLPSYYRGGSYVVYDYPRYRLRPPPRGYHWVRAGNDYVLAAIATGLILEVILGARY